MATRWTRPVSLLTTLACAVPLFAADTVDAEPTVQVKDFAVRPLANLVFDDGAWQLHPKALLGAGYDSNVFAEENDPHKGAYYRALAGVSSSYRINEQNLLSVDGELEADRYVQDKNREGDLTGGRIGGDYVWRERDDDLRVHGGYARYNDPLVETGEQVLRQTADGSAYGTWTGAQTRVALGATFVRTDYLDDAIGFTKASRDNDDYQITARVGYVPARDAFYYLLARYEHIQYDVDTQFNNSNGYTLGLGEQARLGERSTLLLEAGATYVAYDHDFGGSTTYNDKKVVSPYVNAAALWHCANGGQVGLTAFSRLDPSITANAAWVIGAALDGRTPVCPQTVAFGTLSAWYSKDDGHAAGLEAEQRTTEDVRIGSEYELRRGVVTRLVGDYTHSNSKIENSFNRVILEVDIAVVF